MRFGPRVSCRGGQGCGFLGYYVSRLILQRSRHSASSHGTMRLFTGKEVEGSPLLKAIGTG